jgi:hypothetical protein
MATPIGVLFINHSTFLFLGDQCQRVCVEPDRKPDCADNARGRDSRHSLILMTQPCPTI